MDHLTQANPAELEPAIHRLGTTASLAPGVAADFVFRFSLLFLDEGFAGHYRSWWGLESVLVGIGAG